MDRRDARRARVKELRDGGASLRQIAEEVGVSAATALRDVRAAGDAGSSSAAPERPVTASDAPGAGNGTDGVDLSDYESVTAEMQRLYAAMASGVRVPVNQTRLIERRHAELGRQEDICADHMTLATYLDELRWRDTVWQDALEAAFRTLKQAGCADAEDTLNGALQRVSEITKAGRPRSR